MRPPSKRPHTFRRPAVDVLAPHSLGELAEVPDPLSPILLPNVTGGLIDGGTHILPGTVPIAAFAAGIVPPRLVGTLPTLPDVNYPLGATVFYTPTSTLYRNEAGAWVVAATTPDFWTDSIVAGMIAAGAIHTVQLAADAVIANVLNVAGTVEIDVDGITILDGALILTDLFGDNVLVGSGFGTSWIDFIASGFYNGHFGAGTLVDITAPSEVSDGDTPADYLASLSTDLPYWVVNGVGGSGALHREADAAAVGGYALQFSGGMSADIYQDIPIAAGHAYLTMAWMRWTNSGGSSFRIHMGAQFETDQHYGCSTFIEGNELQSGTQSTYALQLGVLTGPAPHQARYLRVTFRIENVSGSPDVMVNRLEAQPDIMGGLYVNNDAIRVTPASGSGVILGKPVGAANWRVALMDTGAMYFGGGSAAADVWFRRTGAGTAIIDKDGAGVALTSLEVIANALVLSSGRHRHKSIISPAQLTANTDNWNPTGLATAQVIRFSTDAARNLTGIVAGVDGDTLRLANIGAFTVTLTHDATSTAANRFLCPTSANFALVTNGWVDLFYDGTSSRWRVVA